MTIIVICQKIIPKTMKKKKKKEDFHMKANKFLLKSRKYDPISQESSKSESF
jgi:hypothetical protein